MSVPYVIMTNWDYNDWQKEFLGMKSQKPSDVKLRIKGAKGFKDFWRLGSLHEEYKRIKKQAKH